MASWALLIIETSLRVAGTNLSEAASKFGSDLYIHGTIALSQGFMLSSMVLSALLVQVIERRFRAAACWAAVAALLSVTGVIHAYELTADGIQNRFGFWEAPEFGAVYGLGALILLYLHYSATHRAHASETAKAAPTSASHQPR
jgi:AGZA family xanthine/uracil permease-like MFS transporter